MITNEQRNALLEYYDATGILKKEIRSYEVSLWTLQDEFITVLKWSDSEQKGRIENPIMTLNVDGTQSFECSIPMYIWANGKLVENPNWYNTYNNNIIVDLRKIKVILNKMTDDEEVFEFVIDEVTESHEKDILTCNIKCSGLAFHELGKVGYKINLSEDTFYEVYKAWEDDENRVVANEPIENLDFWMGENGVGLEYANANQKSTQWYYKVEMDWKSFANDGTSARLTTKIYEEPYTSNWNASLLPTAIENYTEKQRPITVENSNIYNITQTVAETFQVYCRYEYGYDENYHIISRTIVFYNNFMKENDVLSLTYPYSSSKVSRTMDSADLTTKLFVLDIDNQNNLEGYNSIMNSPANKTKEGYILNFDYLYKTKGITEQQYQDLKIFERKIREKNEAIIPLQNQLNKLYNQKPEIEGKKTFYENSADAAQDQIDTNSALKNALTANNGSNNETITVDESHPDQLAVREGDDNVKYVNLTYTNKGIRSKTVKVYTDYHSLAASGSKLINADEITNFTFEYDEYNNPTTLKFGQTVTASMVYLTYEYEPQLYYDSVVKVWKDKMAYDTIKAQEYADLLDDLEDEIEDYEEDLEDLYTEKKELIAAFEHMMGPALREGYWQPEDYKDYGSKFNVSKTFPAAAESDDDYALIWDNELFDEEQNIYYEQGIDLAKKYYPCINLGAVFNNNIPSNIEEYSFIFNNNYTGEDLSFSQVLNSEKQKWVQTFKGTGQAKLAYVRKNSTIYPVLLLVGAKTMTDEEVGFMKDATKGHPMVGIYTTTVSGSSIISNITNSVALMNAHWITLNDTYEIVYPRIQFASLDYDGNNTMVYYNGEQLTRYEDYQPLTRLNNNGVLESIITIKPEVMYKAQTNTGLTEVHYTISNANTQIYLDAMAVSKENAWPKVSYEVTPSIFSKETMRTLYKRLAQLVMINDVQLKFDNIFGYISGMTLDLDNPQNDTLEIKNYKTKFEDLFSNIVAQTESMKTNESLFAAAIRGEIPLATSALETVLTTNVSTFNIMQEYLDSYFDSSEVVQEKLAELFTEAGEILSDSNKSLNQMRSLSTKNASILAGFARNVTEELSVKVVKSQYKPQSFKVGDIWIQTDAQGNEIGRYVATYNSQDVNGDTGNTNSGFVRTYDGTLSSITGAGMTVDTVQGLVDIYGAHEIKLRSGEHVYIGADDTVDIVGNNYVNIGGGTINIAGEANTNSGTAGGINIVSSGISIANSIENMKSYTNWESAHDYQVGDWVKQGTKYYRCKIRHTSGNSFVSTNWAEGTTETIEHQMNTAIANTDGTISKVLIHPDKIEMGSSNILMRGANVIQMVTSTGTSSNTSAIEISPSTGVWIGSGQGVRLFSGGFSYNASNNTLTKTAASGASVELNAEHLILGYSNTKTNSSTAIEMTKSYMIIATGSSLSGNSNDSSLSVTGATGGLVGAKFTKDSIGMAVSSGDTITAFLMDENGFTVGSGGLNVAQADLRAGSNNSVSNGSYTRISKEGIELGSFADLYINTNNFKLQTHSRDKNVSGSSFIDGETIMAIGNNLQNVDYYTMIYDTENNAWKKKNTDGTLSSITFANGAPTVRLLVNKNGLYINGTVYANAGSFTGDVTATTFIANGNSVYFKANSGGIGFYKAGNNNTEVSLLTFGPNGMSTLNDYNFSFGGNLSITSNKNLSINTTNFALDTSVLSGNIIRIGTVESPYLYYTIGGNDAGLHITGVGSFSGTVTSTDFVAQAGSSGNKFKATSSEFGLYTAADVGILTFTSTSMEIASGYTINANGGLTIASTKNFSLDTDLCKINSGASQTDDIMLYMADNANWTSASNGIRYVVGRGLEIKGGGSFTGTISASQISGGLLSGVSLSIGPAGGTPLLSFDSTAATPTLNITGSGSFTGEINATSGSISGNLVVGTLTTATISANNISGGTISAGMIQGGTLSGVSLSIGPTNQDPFLYFNSEAANPELIVKGNIEATTGKIGPFTITSASLIGDNTSISSECGLFGQLGGTFQLIVDQLNCRGNPNINYASVSLGGGVSISGGLTVSGGNTLQGGVTITGLTNSITSTSSGTNAMTLSSSGTIAMSASIMSFTVPTLTFINGSSNISFTMADLQTLRDIIDNTSPAST